MLLFAVAVNDNGCCCVTNGNADTGSLVEDCAFGAMAAAAVAAMPVVMLPPAIDGTDED